MVHEGRYKLDRFNGRYNLRTLDLRDQAGAVRDVHSVPANE
jgi:hypothetical protein